MNVQEGARRMRYAGVWLALIPACWCVLVLCIQMAFLGFRMGGIMGGLGIVEIIVAATPGILLCIAAWIVEGFSMHPN